MFWLRVLAIAQIALVARHHLTLLEPDERMRLARLVARSKGRPRTNLSANEREEMLRLAQKLEPGAFAHGVWGAARGRLRGKPGG
jgi:chorismate mutase